ncbi:LTA synthase family protein [Larkinella soli]|uniref:LTA synthase family protein n=1 Tax=Larkinella soli TaxID=1770527 RepID=UPI0013E3C5D8|nr:LTA synthase family protein [Larkinella soli]
MPILLHGYYMDLSVAAYLCLIPGVWLALAPSRLLYPVIQGYTVGMVVLVSLMMTVDLEVYRAWGFRLDTTLFRYLNTPREAFASIGSSPLGTLVALWIGMVLASLTAFRFANFRLAGRRNPGPLALRSWFSPIPVLAATAALIIPIRGGLQLAPMNVSAVFFSPNAFSNYAAISPQWNFIHSWLEREKAGTENPFSFFPEKKARQTIQALYQPSAGTEPLLTTQRPNLILIIWESLTAKAVASLGGRTGVTPEFERLSREGLLFNQMYASGDRSDKGLIAILSGFPAQPTSSIMTIPSKAAKLPKLGEQLKEAGYHTSFYYGGETEFANIKSYLYHSRYDRIVSKSEFPSSSWNSKWGAHDHVVYGRILADLAHETQPFFTTFFTLSSHEPFEVPMPTVIAGKDEESQFLNALYYADRSLGQFIDQARKQRWWQNTLVIVMADHGHCLPVLNGQGASTDKTRDFHIPMLWLGGALKAKPQVISRIGSQTDLAATLLRQLGMDASAFAWSRDLFNRQERPFAYFAFNNGFGIVQPDRHLVFDNASRQLISSQGVIEKQDIELGKAYEEISFQEFLNK